MHCQMPQRATISMIRFETEPAPVANVNEIGGKTDGETSKAATTKTPETAATSTTRVIVEADVRGGEGHRVHIFERAVASQVEQGACCLSMGARQRCASGPSNDC
jgi:hypothetical protein